MKYTEKFEIAPNFVADCFADKNFITGEIYHVQKNISTPIARYFVYESKGPNMIEGFNEHKRIDCYVRKHKLAPEAMWLGDKLVRALIREKICSEPIFISVFISETVDGKAYGAVFEG